MNGLFGINGLGGFILSVVVLLCIVVFLGYQAIMTQRTTATQSYSIENVNALQSVNKENINHYKTKN